MTVTRNGATRSPPNPYTTLLDSTTPDQPIDQPRSVQLETRKMSRMHLVDKVKARSHNLAIEKLVRTKPRADMVRLGTSYGGWWLPQNLIDKQSICYLVGLGEDASFDLALTEGYGCEVWSMDPTPRSITFAETIDDPRFHFMPVGVWSSEKTLRFYAPQNPTHVSHSIVNAQGTTTYFEAECKTLLAIMAELGHDRIDLLKMNIEGAETEVVADMLANGPTPRVLLVAFESASGTVRDLRCVRSLTAHGYIPVAVQGHSITFVRD